MRPATSSARSDLWACRAGLVLDALLLAWIGGRVAAGGRSDDVARLVLVVVIAVVSVVAATATHGRRLFLGPETRPREMARR